MNVLYQWNLDLVIIVQKRLYDVFLPWRYDLSSSTKMVLFPSCKIKKNAEIHPPPMCNVIIEQSLSGNIPCWIETLKTWNRIFFKPSYASIIMLLLKSSKPAALFCFQLLSASSNSSKFNSPNCIFFHYEMSKSLEIFFQCWGFFSPILIQQK